MINTLSPEQVKELMISEPETLLLDVREQWEYDVVHLPGSILAPMSEFMKHLESLDKDKKTVVYCHHGARSLSVCAFLTSKGFTDVANLDGGINEYALTVDKTLARY